MRALVISDTHGYLDNLKKVLAAEGEFDVLIHCGDVEWDAAKIRGMVGCPCRMVKGNCDYFGDDLPNDQHFSFGTYPVFMTHGHRYGVNYGLDRLYYKALEDGAKVVIFGHTHVPMCEEVGDVVILNPGSLTHPRGQERKHSYAIMSIDDNGLLDVELKSVEDLEKNINNC